MHPLRSSTFVPCVKPRTSLVWFRFSLGLVFSFFNATATTEIYTLSLHDALPISGVAENLARDDQAVDLARAFVDFGDARVRSEEHTSELQSLRHLVCRLLLEKKKNVELRSSTQRETRPHWRPEREHDRSQWCPAC